jgi:ribosome-binding ATPase YchF (GTP1/OBG family)
MHGGTPEIPLPESMAGQPSPGKRTLLQAVVLAPHYLVSIANLPFSKHFFA